MKDADNNQISWRLTIILSAVSAISAVLCYSPAGLSTMAWVCLVPWLYSLPRQNLRQMLAGHGVFIFFYFVLGLQWMMKVHPTCPFLVIFPLYFICIPFPVLYWLFGRKWPRHRTLLAPILWCAGDYLRSFLFTGFPWLFLGHSQAFHTTIIQIADITGVYGITFIIVFVNAVFTCWLDYWLKREAQWKIPAGYTIAAVSILALILIYGHYRPNSVHYDTGAKIAAIQGNIPQDIKEDPKQNQKRIAQSYDTLTYEVLQKYPEMDLLVWPETMALGDPFLSPSGREKLEDMILLWQKPMLIGAHHIKIDPKDRRADVYNCAYYFDKNGKLQERYDKVHLVILGEYLPLQKVLPFLPKIVRQVAGFLPNLSPGEKKPVFTLQENKFGVLICYDIVYAPDARELRNKGCQFILNITNEGWFADTGELEQLLAISIFRAVENRMGIVRVGNTGITGNIAPDGRLLREELLTIPYEKHVETLEKYTPFTKDRVVGRKKFAWHHFPQALWTDASLIAPRDHDWDVQLQAQKVKWKDFPGIFYGKAPLATKETTIYTRFGDLFAQIISMITIVLVVLQFVNRNEPISCVC